VQNSAPTFQIIDPSIEIDGDYVYVTYGLSDRSEENQTHNYQRVKFVRFEKAKLFARDWDASTISDMTFPKSLEITKLPERILYGYGDIFSHSGLEITQKAMDGTTSTHDFREFKVFAAPDMYTYGKQTITLYNKYNMQVSYEITVAKKFNVIWNVSPGGTVEPMPRTAVEGDSPVFALLPEDGMAALEVLVNGNPVKIEKNAFTVENVSDDLEITVTFGEKQDEIAAMLNSPLPLVFGGAALVLVAGAAVALFILKKKGMLFKWRAPSPAGGGGE
jgi:hypothetical protein